MRAFIVSNISLTYTAGYYTGTGYWILGAPNGKKVIYEYRIDMEFLHGIFLQNYFFQKMLNLYLSL